MTERVMHDRYVYTLLHAEMLIAVVLAFVHVSRLMSSYRREEWSIASAVIH